MCHNERNGERVADTAVIRAIRNVKTRLKMATNNTLVVCDNCLEPHAKRLKSYERKMLLHAVLAAVLLVLIIVVPLLASSFNPGSILVGLLMGGLIIALPLMDYVPPLASGRDVLAELKAAQAQAAAQAASASARPAPSTQPAAAQPSSAPASSPIWAPVSNALPKLSGKNKKSRLVHSKSGAASKSKSAHSRRR